MARPSSFKRTLLTSALAAGAIGMTAMSLMSGATPARAQLSVFDPSNYSQNILTAARTLQQINNQITMLQNQAQSLINQARNLTTIGFPELQAITQTIQQIDQLMGQAQSIRFRVANLDQEFRSMFPTSFDQLLTSDQHIAGARSRFDASMAAYKQTMTVQAQVVENIAADQSTLTGIVQRSQSAQGALQAMSLVLASLALFGLGIFGPGIASGLVAGAPQLGAGAALGTVAGAGGLIYLGGAGAAGAARGVMAGALGAVRAGTTMGSAASTAYGLGQEASGSATVGAGLGGMARAAGAAARARMSAGLGLGEARESGRQAARDAMSGADTPGAQTGRPDDGVPGWARAMKSQASARHHRQTAMHTVQQGDRGGAGANPDIKERED